MKVWIDVLTSKQATLFGYLARELLMRGFKVIVTCREYEYTEGGLKRLGINPIVIGSYAEGDAYDKVTHDINRMSELLKIVKHEKPTVLIAYPNPSAARVAFGLGIKYIAITDSPHAEIPSRLSLPLADIVITSRCIPQAEILSYLYVTTKLYQYNGVDEVSWLIRSKPDINYIRTLGLEEFKYVVLRPHESLATYYRGHNVYIDMEKLIQYLNSEGYDIVFLPRYSIHEALAKKLLKQGLKVKVIREYYDGVSLTYYALAVISGGASLAREAALLHTVGITYFPKKLYVNECIKKFGYPLYDVHDMNDLKRVLKAIDIHKYKKKSFNNILHELKSRFEDLISLIIKILINEVRG